MTSYPLGSTRPATPVDREWLAGRIVTLLKHYFEADQDPAVIREMAGDWLEILSPYPEGAIAAACTAYLIEEPRRRPTPGAIRALAVKAMDRDARLAPALPPPDRLRLTEAPRERCTPEAAARILAEAGLSPARLAAIAGGRRMPPPRAAGHVAAEPGPPATVEEIVARPYTAAQIARTRAMAAAGAFGRIARRGEAAP